MTTEYVNITPDVDHDDPVDLYRRLGRTLPPLRALSRCRFKAVRARDPRPPTGEEWRVKGLLPKEGVANVLRRLRNLQVVQRHRHRVARRRGERVGWPHGHAAACDLPRGRGPGRGSSESASTAP